MSNASSPRHLADDDAVGTHTQAVDEQLPLADRALAFDVRRPRFQPDNVLLRKLQFGGILDRDQRARSCGMYCERIFRKVVLPAPVPPEIRMLIRARTAAASISIISGGDTLQLHQLVRSQRTGAETADGQSRAVERQRRNDRIDTRAVGQARIHHRRRLIHPAAYARDDAVDDLQQVAIVAERRIGLLEHAAFLNEHMVLAVDQDVGDLWIAQQRLERAQTEDLIQQIGLDLLLLIQAERHLLLADDLASPCPRQPAVPEWS